MAEETKDEYTTPFSLKYGRNPVPNIFDAKAKDPTSRPYAYIAKSATNPADGFDEIRYPKITNAINRVSWWLVNEAGLADGDAFAYMGPSDLRYVAFTIAALKTGRKVGFSLFILLDITDLENRLLKCRRRYYCHR